jgi:indole-3-glycerol phosphate synthase
MSDFLAQVIASRREYVREARRVRPEDELIEQMPHNAWTRAHESLPRGRFTMGGIGDAFTAALFSRRAQRRLGVIAELKRRSPALGTLASPDLSVAKQIARYETGAVAISVLTEPAFWGGSLDDLRAARASTDLPILCKDVIVDEYQIIEARAAGADAVLLIAEALSDDELRRFASRAASLSMGTLVEAHEAVAFGRAVEHGGSVVGVNARDLRNPQDIDIGRARQLHTFVKPHQVLVAESGIASVDDARLLPARVDAVLVGTALMREPDPMRLVADLAAIPRESRSDVIVVRERLRGGRAR